MRLPIIIGTPLLMLFLGLGLEIATFMSNKSNGFRVPKSDVFDLFGDVSAQFLASFLPTLMIIPIAFTWRELDWMLRWYQPYVVLQKGNARAEESLLLDYIALGPFLALFRALHYKHRVIFWSSLSALLTYLFQPLIGSVFQIRSISQTDIASVTSTKSIGLAQDIADLDSFIAAAGYVEASVLHNLNDPPFIKGGWATAEFTFPVQPYLNGTLTVNTAGLQTNANCSNPVEKPTLTPQPGTTLLNLSSKSIDGCVHSLTFDPSVSTQQYGVDDVPCPGDASTLDPTLRPVMFWYFRLQNPADASSREVKTVFCTPRIQSFEVQTVSKLNDGSLVTVAKVGPLKGENTVFNGTQAGRAYNGLIFNNNTNPFIQAKAITTRSLIPAAVLRSASQSSGGLQGTFDLANGFLDHTSKLYTRHLSISAKSIYFLNQNTTLSGDIVSLVPRLKVDPLPAHVLSLVLILTGFVGIFLHVINRRRRMKLRLASPPGSIAAVIALTSRSGFGQLLLPYDDEETMERKLEGLRFRLDKRTGAIMADEDDLSVSGGTMEKDGPMASLLGRTFKKQGSSEEGKGLDDDYDLEESDVAHSSSHLAYQAAAGVLPWERSWNPSGPGPLKSPGLSKTAYIP